VAGPFGGEGTDCFNTVYSPEHRVDQGDWRTVSTDSAGYLNFLDHLSPTDWVCAYAYCKVISPQARSAQIRLGTNDTATLWFNGEKILSKNIERSAAPDSDILPVQLRKGENTILIKVCNTEFNWGLYLRISDDEGTALKNLTFRP
jgi:hypothetical protein